MSSNFRGTPNRGQGRGGTPYANSPTSSSIPRPVLENVLSTPTPQSDVGGSSLSSSRQKQSKKDEVSTGVISYYAKRAGTH